MSKTLTRVVLPIVLFIALIGGITWAVQFMPRGTVKPPPSNPTPGPSMQTAEEILHYSRRDRLFSVLRAVWAREEKLDETTGAMVQHDSYYTLEYERLKDGSCYFTFRNTLGAPAEMGMKKNDCDCGYAEVCLLPKSEWDTIDAMLDKTPWGIPAFKVEPAWRRFTRDNHDGFKVPTDGHGVLRIVWHGKKAVGEPLRLHLQFYGRPDGSTGDGQIERVIVPVVMAPPLRFEPMRPSLGYLNPGDKQTVEFYCWSPTRDNPDVSFQPREADPLVQVETRKLSETECKNLQKKLHDDENRDKKDTAKRPLRYRVKSAFVVKATFHEHKGDRQMDLGHFERTIPVFLDELPVDFATPVITGVVKGDVEVGGVEDQGKVQLKAFPAADDRTVVVPIYADTKTDLKIDSHHPPILKVDLKRNVKASTPQRARWDLKVTVPAQSWLGGSLPESSAVVLQSAGPPPRLIRIPVTGTATR